MSIEPIRLASAPYQYPCGCIGRLNIHHILEFYVTKADVWNRDMVGLILGVFGMNSSPIPDKTIVLDVVKYLNG